MASTYVNDLRLEEMATGDQSGTWGDTTNVNLELIAEAFSYGTEASFSSDADATTTIADGASDPARSLYLKVTSGASLTATRTLTIAPNTVSKVWIIENATSGSQSISISQGSGANVTIPNGDVKVIYTDGAGAGAAVVDAFANLKVTDAAQTNITSVGALDGGSITSGFGSIDVGSSAITTTGTVTGNTLAGTLSTAAQPNITSVGTLTGFTSTGIDDNATSTAITIDSSENVGIGTASPSRELELSAANPRFRITDTDGGYAEISGNSGHLSFAADVGGTQGGTRITFDVDGGEIARFNSSGKLGIGTTTIPAKLTVSAASATDGILLQDSNTSSAAPTVQVIGQRSDGNASQSFSGGLALAQNQTNAKGSDNKKLGTVYFGINHTDGTAANIAYSASISAELSGDANSATDMPTDLCFYTGSTGRDLGTANQTFGDEALRIAASGRTGILNTDPNAQLHIGDANVEGDATNPALQIGGTTTYRLGLYTQAERGVIDCPNGDDGLDFRVKTAGLAMRVLATTGGVLVKSASAFGTTAATANDITMGLTGTNTTGIKFDTASTAVSGNARVYLVENKAGDRLSFSTGAGTEIMAMVHEGNVGIGTTSPTQSLEVYKAGFNAAQISGDSTSETQLRFNGNTAARIHNESNTALIFATNASEVARFDNSGNFGIGITAPFTNLHVQSNGAPDSSGNMTSGIIVSDTTGGPAVKVSVNNAAGYNYLQSAYVNNANVGRDLAIVRGNSEKIRVTTDGLTFNGDTAAANALDDYEEGTWTPSITFNQSSTGITHDVQNGKYVKIGSAVYVSCHCSLTSKGTAVGVADLNGLPFTINQQAFGAFQPIGDRQGLSTAGVPVNLYVAAGNTYTRLYKNGFTGTGNTTVTNANFTNTTDIDVNFVYYTDS